RPLNVTSPRPRDAVSLNGQAVVCCVTHRYVGNAVPRAVKREAAASHRAYSSVNGVGKIPRTKVNVHINIDRKPIRVNDIARNRDSRKYRQALAPASACYDLNVCHYRFFSLMKAWMSASICPKV